MPQAATLYLLNRLLCGPLEVLFTLLIFILSKNLDADPFQLMLIACIKPISSLFAFYTSSFIFDHPVRIRYYLMITTLCGCLPCFLYPFIENVWYFMGSYALFMIITRASYPAWIEFLKENLELSSLSKIISRGTSIYYFMGIVLPPVLCFFMDQIPHLWRYLFAGLAFLQLMNLLLVHYIQIKPQPLVKKPYFNPLKKGCEILRNNPPFFHYQILFFLGGAGIIGSQSVLPFYFKDQLNLSYTQLGIAFSFCKGISFVCSSPWWALYVNRLSLYQLNCIVNLFTCLFFAFVISASLDVNWLCVAYLLYGTMQAGSEMSWNLSGPIFSGVKESTIYSSLNLVFVGLRGCLCPLLGYLLFSYSGAITVFVVSATICLLGILYGLWSHHRYKTQSISFASTPS